MSPEETVTIAVAVTAVSLGALGFTYRSRDHWRLWWARLAAAALGATGIFLAFASWIVLGDVRLDDGALIPIGMAGFAVAFLDLIAGLESLAPPEGEKGVLLGVLLGVLNPILVVLTAWAAIESLVVA